MAISPASLDDAPVLAQAAEAESAISAAMKKR